MKPGRTGIVVMGIFAADLTFRASRLPRLGETLLSDGSSLGPGGKASNQAIAAARLGARVRLLSRIGDDAFGRLALDTWRNEGVDTGLVQVAPGESTGCAFIFVSTETGQNAIVVDPGASRGLDAASVAAADHALSEAAVFVVQLEQSLDAMRAGLQAARRHGAVTILNPAPAPREALGDDVYALCDFVTPNETEAEAITGIHISTIDDARAAARRLLHRGAGCVVLTLGERGALVQDRTQSELVPAIAVPRVVDTSGAGDAFNGAFAFALTRGDRVLDAVRFANTAAGLSVTREGTAASMPTLAEVQAASA